MTAHSSRALLLSEATGQPVLRSRGQAFGHVADLTVDLHGQAGPHLVERLVVRRSRAPDLLLPWAAIERFDRAGVVVHGSVDPDTMASDPTTSGLGFNEILLRRDVLDTQVVDLVGQRLARVADVVLALTAAGRLELIGVEVGFGAVLRRLGLRRLAAHTREDVVAWTDLHLTSERGHDVQLATPRSRVHHLDAAALSALISHLDTESAADILAVTKPEVAAAAVHVSHPTVGERVLRAMTDAQAAKVVAAMPAEHATRWRARLSHTPAFLGRRFLRSRVWPRHRNGRSGSAS